LSEGIKLVKQFKAYSGNIAFANFYFNNIVIKRFFFKLHNKVRHYYTHSINIQFRTVLSLIIKGIEHQFEGICKGTILATRKGKGGFGYDPLFLPNGSIKTFAEMDMQEKNKFSHRKKAMDKMVNFLNSPGDKKPS
jgi:non-canonical purine NTP pyrophosphatase (RdgB/HAM1 family)